jgi:glycosyltransferase involved in cell wall biosynthesis
MARFLLVTHIYPPAIDGGSRVIAKMGEYFRSQGHEIMVLTSDATSTDDFTHAYQRVNNPGLPVYTTFHRPLKLISKVLSKGPIFKIVPFFKFLFLCFKFKPDYIIAGPMPTTTILYARLIRLFTHSKLIINASFHPTDPEFHQPILINTLKSADFVWTLTDFETNYFHKNFGIPKSKLINIGNGIDSSLITKSPTIVKNKLLFIGSFSAHKGLETLFAAFKLLPKKYSLTIAGNPTLHKLNIPKNIKVLTNFKSKKLAHIIDQCSILISPSTQESFGLVLLEAMARGKPVIAANIPASAELVKKSKGGLLFEPGNPQDLAAKILKISLDRHGLSYAINHTWDKIGESLWQKISS